MKGHTFFGPELPESELKSLWDRHKVFLMSLIGKDVGHSFSGFALRGVVTPFGTRCFAWWAFSSPGPRRLLRGSPAGAMPERGLHFGKPRLYTTLEAYNAMKFESQLAYLERLGLLMPNEKEKIRPELIRV